jgi:protein-tyrosine phosphatase
MAHWSFTTHGLFLHKKKSDISKQKEDNSIGNDLETYDYIYVMDKSNYDDVIALAQTSEQKKQSTNYFE